jgi:hypothetical protein
MGYLHQESISNVARCLLYRNVLTRSHCSDVADFDCARQSPFCGQQRDESHVCIRLVTAQAMIEVCNVKGKIEFTAQARQYVQQAQGIAPSRYPYNRNVADIKKVPVLYLLSHNLQYMHSWRSPSLMVVLGILPQALAPGYLIAPALNCGIIFHSRTRSGVSMDQLGDWCV